MKNYHIILTLIILPSIQLYSSQPNYRTPLHQGFKNMFAYPPHYQPHPPSMSEINTIISENKLIIDALYVLNQNLYSLHTNINHSNPQINNIIKEELLFLTSTYMYSSQQRRAVNEQLNNYKRYNMLHNQQSKYFQSQVNNIHNQKKRIPIPHNTKEPLEIINQKKLLKKKVNNQITKVKTKK